MRVEMNQDFQVKDKTPRIGFYAITAGFFGLVLFLLFRPIPEANKASVYTMLGALGTAWAGCVNYYYGSSSGSREPLSSRSIRLCCRCWHSRCTSSCRNSA